MNNKITALTNTNSLHSESGSPPLAKRGLAIHNKKQSNENNCCHYKICGGINLQLCKLLNDVKPLPNSEFSSALNVSLQSKIVQPGVIRSTGLYRSEMGNILGLIRV